MRKKLYIIFKQKAEYIAHAAISKLPYKFVARSRIKKITKKLKIGQRVYVHFYVV